MMGNYQVRFLGGERGSNASDLPDNKKGAEMPPSPFSLERQIVFLFPEIHWRLRYGGLYGCRGG